MGTLDEPKSRCRIRTGRACMHPEELHAGGWWEESGDPSFVGSVLYGGYVNDRLRRIKGWEEDIKEINK